MKNIDFQEKVEDIASRIRLSEPCGELNVTVMCQEGRHRSISVVEEVIEILTLDNFEISVRHLSLEE